MGAKSRGIDGPLRSRFCLNITPAQRTVFITLRVMWLRHAEYDEYNEELSCRGNTVLTIAPFVPGLSPAVQGRL